MIKKIIKELLPPVLCTFLNKYRPQKYGWKGSYLSWEDAENKSSKYDSDEILNRVKESLLKVKNGEAVYERDSVIFDKVQYSWPLLTGLMLASARLNNDLRVLDFGGSLGSTYFQNINFLKKIDNVSWSIIEQNHFVDIGKAEFEDEVLSFFYDIKTCIEEENSNVLVLSSVIQYMEYPYRILDEMLIHKFEYILVDRTPFSSKMKNEIKLQIVPEEIYSASYPCWFFDECFFINYFLSKGYKVIEEFDALDGKSDDYYFKGYIFEHVK